MATKVTNNTQLINNNIIITENVFKKVEKLIKSENNLELALRISVEGGGCSGFSYKYELVSNNDLTADDSIFENGLTKVIIDAESKQLMSDSIIDFIEELGGSYFDISNPKAKGKCGCGNSFSV
ncbi:HesB/IscA family protein [Candidatus Tisiphia endosymbiont of Beris chalybata]|uniref:HesB/IscA family protein n=1 Tax=Candidatus Tisiphia endosymbiont of Beris chalybata TaxID=3066262 RepID=UPI00312C767B